MENLELILSISATALGLLAAAATFLVKFIKAVKGQHSAEQRAELDDALLTFIEQAEKIVGGSGKDKKQHVMEAAEEYAEKAGIELDDGETSGKVERLITFTKEVNKRKKDAQTKILSHAVGKEKKEE